VIFPESVYKDYVERNVAQVIEMEEAGNTRITHHKEVLERHVDPFLSVSDGEHWVIVPSEVAIVERSPSSWEWRVHFGTEVLIEGVENTHTGAKFAGYDALFQILASGPGWDEWVRSPPDSGHEATT
jgi:hypothetical protein